MLRNMFFVLSILICAVGIPINVYFNLKSPFGSTLSTRDAFILMTPSLVRGKALVAHVAIGYIVNMTVIYFFYTNYQKVISMRRRVFMSKQYQRTLFMRTLLVTEVPNKYTSDNGLANLLGSFASPKVEQVDIGRNVRALGELHEKYNAAIFALEKHLAKYLKNPDRLPSKRPMTKPMKEDKGNLPAKVDAINYYMVKLKTLKEKIDYAALELDVNDRLPYGFVSYGSQPEAHQVAQKASKQKSRVGGALVKLAPRPEDIIWKNIVLGKYERANKQWWGNVFFAVLMIAWIVPNAFIGCFLSDLSRLGVLWHGYQVFLDGHPTMFAILQGVLSPLVTSFIFLILPMIMRRMSSWQGKLTKNEREHDVTVKLYTFFFFNNFFVFTMMSVIWNVASQIMQYVDSNNHSMSFREVFDKLQIGEQIATAIINASSFWVMYILKANLGAVFDLLQVFTLVWNSFKKHALSPTPREMMLLTAPQSFNFSVYYIWVLFYSTIALAFTSIQPIIFPMLTFYLSFDIILKKYSLMYMFVTKAESDGKFWPLTINCMLFALAVGDIILLAVVWIQGGMALGIAVAPLVLFVIIFKIYVVRKFNPQFRFFIPTLSEQESMAQSLYARGETESMLSSNLDERYRNPIVNRRLPVPMVHAKAIDKLAAVCNVNDDIFHGSGIQSFDGINNHSAMQEFDIVRENELDYSHYKKRAINDDSPEPDLENQYKEHPFVGENIGYSRSDIDLQPSEYGSQVDVSQGVMQQPHYINEDDGVRLLRNQY